MKKKRDGITSFMDFMRWLASVSYVSYGLSVMTRQLWPVTDNTTLTCHWLPMPCHGNSFLTYQFRPVVPMWWPIPCASLRPVLYVINCSFPVHWCRWWQVYLLLNGIGVAARHYCYQPGRTPHGSCPVDLLLPRSSWQAHMVCGLYVFSSWVIVDIFMYLVCLSLRTGSGCLIIVGC